MWQLLLIHLQTNSSVRNITLHCILLLEVYCVPRRQCYCRYSISLFYSLNARLVDIKYELFNCFVVQNVPPALLVRFLREHRSEWADYGVDAYSAACLKASAYAVPCARSGGFPSGQVILPLANTVENEEVTTFYFIRNFFPFKFIHHMLFLCSSWRLFG